MTGEPAAHGTGSRAQAVSDVGTDAALVLAAVTRMQAADQEARETLARLRHGLGAMAEAIDRAKAQNAAAAAAGHEDLAKVVDIAAVLDEFEHLVDGLIEVATGHADDEVTAPQVAAELPQPAGQVSAPATEAAAPSPPDIDQVPTVSGVVSRLDPEQPTELAEAEVREQVLTHASAPSVEMLKSLVEALNASIPDDTPEAEALAESPGYQATAKVMAQDVIQAFAWELTRSDTEGTPEAIPAGATGTETSEAPQVAAPEPPEQVAELAEITPTEPAISEAVAVQTVEALQETEAPQAFEAPQEAAIAQDLAPEPTRTPEPESAQQAEPDSAQRESAQDAEPLVFDVVVEFDPVEPQPAPHAEAIETLAEPVEATAPIPAAEPAEISTHAATAGNDNDVYDPPGHDVLAAETEAAATAAIPATARDASLETVEPAFDSAEAPAELAVAPVAAEPIHAEAAPVEAAPAETTSAEVAAVETAALESAPVEYTLADLPAMPHEAPPEDFVVEQLIAETEHPVVAAAEPAAEPAPVAGATPAEPVAFEAPAAAASAPGDAVVELMARLQQMEALPILPPELGTAVIFGRRDAQSAEAADVAESKPPADLLPAVDLDVEPEAAATAETVAEAVPETTAEAEPQAMAQAAEQMAGEVAAAEMFAAPEPVAIEAAPAPELAAAEEAAMEAIAAAEPAVAHEPVAEVTAVPAAEIAAEPEVITEAAAEVATEAAPQPTNGETKLADLEAEPDPDDFLFEPGDNAGSATSTNGIEATAGELAAAAPPAAEQAAPAAPAKPTPPADPLIPIKAMSPEERIALFS